MENYLLGDYVKEYRQAHKLSLRDFGNLCGISHTTIDCIEKGYDPRTKKAVNITNSTFSKLSDAMGIPVHVLVDLSLGNDELLRVPGGWASRSYLAAKVAEREPAVGAEDGNEEKKPVPTDGDGLDEQDRQLVELMKLLTADQKEFLRAQLLTLTGRDK